MELLYKVNERPSWTKIIVFALQQLLSIIAGTVTAPLEPNIVIINYWSNGVFFFQDGNGRVGRLIAFKECLKNDIVPFIILDSKKEFYYRGLKNWDRERGWLIDTCLDGQDTVKAYLDYFSIQYK